MTPTRDSHAWTRAQVADDPSEDDVPPAVRRLISPLRAQLSAIVVEYGLQEGRF